MYVLDTNVIVDFIRGRSPHIYDMLRDGDASMFKVPSIVKAELLLGAEKAAKPDEERFRVESVLLPFEILPFDDDCAFQYAHIRGHLEAKGQTIGSNDYLIAATALAHSAVLVSHNAKEFSRVPGLILEDWCEVDL